MDSFTPQELQTEEWCDVIDYAGIYSVSSLGRVRRDRAYQSTHSGRILKQTISRRYLVVQLSDRTGGKKQKCCRVNILVARAFIGPCPPGKEVNHKDTHRTNNRASNLEYITHRENIAHSVAHGLTATGAQHGSHTHPECWSRGESHGNAKLTERDIPIIRQAMGRHRDIAASYGVGRTLITKIKARELWKHVP